MNTSELRKAAVVVFIAVEEPVAQDLSLRLEWAADRIDTLEAQLAKLREAAGKVGFIASLKGAGWQSDLAAALAILKQALEGK